MNSYKALTSEKSSKILKLRKKLHNSDPKLDLPQDFLLETSGDVRTFLSPSFPIEKLPKLTPIKLYKHNIIAGITQFNPKISETDTNRLLTHKSTIRFASKNQSTHSAALEKEDHQIKFQNAIKRINEAIERSRIEEKERFSLLAGIHKGFAMKHSQSIGKSFENLGASKGKIPSFTPLPKEINGKTCHRENKSQNFDVGDKFTWYMSLRGNSNSKLVESYTPIGNKLTGLYSKVMVLNPNYKGRSGKDEEGLVVVGENKLEREMKAVEKVGIEFFRPELLVKDELRDEIIAEQYDHSQITVFQDSLLMSSIE